MNAHMMKDGTVVITNEGYGFEFAMEQWALKFLKGETVLRLDVRADDGRAYCPYADYKVMGTIKVENGVLKYIKPEPNSK